MAPDPRHVPKDRSSPTPEPEAALPPRPEPLGVRLRHAPVTGILLATCTILYAITLVATLSQSADPVDTALSSLWSLSLTESTDAFRQLGALELSRIWLDHEWWRLLTTGLLHGSLLHLVLNMVALLSIGEWVEHAWGHLRTFALFILSSIGGGLASLAWCESPLVLGASAGILGQAGALWFARLAGPAELQAELSPISARRLGILILVCLALGLLVPGIAQAGHLGGLAVGLLLGAIWSTRPLPIRLVLSGTLAALLGALVWQGSAPTNRANYHAILGFRLLDEQQFDAALNLFNRGLELEPESPHFRNAIAYQLALDGVQLDRAEALVLDALAQDRLNPSYLDTLAWVWCRQGHTEAGLNTLHAAAFLSSAPFPELTEHLESCASAAVFHVEHP